MTLYAAFDRYPSSKGAAIHIRHMAQALFEARGGGMLCVLGDDALPAYQREGDIQILRFRGDDPNLLRRTLLWSAWLAEIVRRQADQLTLCHFRDPFSGVGIVEARPPGCKLIYEVNGMPSVELPETWPQVAPQTLAKIAALEDRCLAAADLIVTPAQVIADHVRARGTTAPVVVIPNGAEVLEQTERPAGAPERYLIYVGALQRWQGVDVALRAFSQLADLDLHLVVVSSHHRGRSRALRRLAKRLGVADRVVWKHQLRRETVARWLSHAALSLAPLTASARNLDQGCCPIKILESMAAGVPVVASDLPCVRELVRHGEHGLLVPPDRPAELARAARIVLEYPEQARAMGARGRALIVGGLTWQHARDRLKAALGEHDLLPQTPSCGA